MKNRKIILLKKYRNILLEIKRIQIIQILNDEVERKLPTYKESNQKVLVLRKKA